MFIWGLFYQKIVRPMIWGEPGDQQRIARMLDPRQGDDFAGLGVELLRTAGDAFPIRNAIVIEVERVRRIRAPSSLLPHQTEAELIAQVCRAYGVVRPG